jgi:predicted transcriptional regulator
MLQCNLNPKNKDSTFITDLSISDESLRNGQATMRKSKLESYEDILEALVNGPLTLDALASEAHLNLTLLEQNLKFLIKSALVEDRKTENTTAFAITEKGTTVIKVLNFQKYLRRIKGTIRTICEALEILPEISQRSTNSEKPRD